MINNIKKLEVLLFASGNNGLSSKEISTIMDITIKNADELVKELEKNFLEIDSPLKIEQFGEQIKLSTKKEFNELLSKFIDEKPNRLAQSSMETLAIIAYKGPITRVEVEVIRGVDCNFAVSKLVSLDLIWETGRAETAGAPILYSVTPHFMDTFKVKSLSDLPDFNDLKNEDIDGQNLFNTKYKENHNG